MRYIPLTLICSIFSAVSAMAQNATTVPVGAVTITIPPAVGGVPKTSLVSFPLISKSEAAGAQIGRITSVTQNSISNSSAGWTAGQLSTAATPHLLRITSGAAKGLALPISTTTPNTSTTVTINAEEDALVDLTTLGIQVGATTGDTYEIVPCDTLRSLFGDTTDGIVGSTGPTGVDVVMMMVSGAWTKYYFNTTLNSWRQVGPNSLADNVIVRPDAAVVFTRVGATELKITLVGEVPSRERRVVLKNSATTPLATFWPKTVTLGTSGIENIPGWVRSTDVNAADIAMIMVSGAWTKYYHNNTRWQQVGPNSDATSVQIPVGTGAILTRKSGTGASIASQDVPYTLN